MTERLGWVFPGQGSQQVGMGRDWADRFAAAREVFAEANDVLGFALTELCWNGPEEDLQLTANTQPAILATSIAIFRSLPEEYRSGALAAGHSLGEYSALVAAGVLSLADALRLVRKRGELMQRAVPVGEGAMAAIIGLDREAVEALIERAGSDANGAGHCGVANYNSPEQTVIVGHHGAVDRAIELAKEQGAKRALLLPVSAPFHSSLMAPAREGLEPDLAATTFSDAAVPVVTNVDARAVRSGAEARQALVRQIDSPVRWVESIEYMIAAGVERFVEIGPGKVLMGLSRRIDRSVPCRAVSLADLES